jgi:hypothetical protein
MPGGASSSAWAHSCGTCAPSRQASVPPVHNAPAGIQPREQAGAWGWMPALRFALPGVTVRLAPMASLRPVGMLQSHESDGRKTEEPHGSRHDPQGEAAGGEGPRHGARGDHAAGARVRGGGRQGRPLDLHQAAGGDPRGPEGQGQGARPVELLAYQVRQGLRPHHGGVRLPGRGDGLVAAGARDLQLFRSRHRQHAIS